MPRNPQIYSNIKMSDTAEIFEITDSSISINADKLLIDSNKRRYINDDEEDEDNENGEISVKKFKNVNFDLFFY